MSACRHHDWQGARALVRRPVSWRLAESPLTWFRRPPGEPPLPLNEAAEEEEEEEGEEEEKEEEEEEAE